MENLHRLWITVSTTKQWYDVIRECQSWFGKNWQSQSKVKKKIQRLKTVTVWFDVPDPKFSTWISIKFGLEVHGELAQKGR